MNELSMRDTPTHSLPVLHAKLVAIYVSSGHDYWGRQGAGRLQHGIQEVSEAECVAGHGLRGDRYFHKKAGHIAQVTFISLEVVEEIRQLFKLPKLPASVFRRNLVVDGGHFKSLMGKRFLFQGLEFEGTQECKPCQWMDRAIADGAQEYLQGSFKGGLRAKVHTTGVLRVEKQPCVA